MRKHISTIILILIILVGVSVILYPSFSDWFNKSRTARVVSSYQDAIQDIDSEKMDEMIEKAHDYNKMLAACSDQYSGYKSIPGYEDTLNIAEGVMGYISIPVIQVEYPIYHGTSDDVLNVAIGHIEGSSLPVGGDDTHSVLSGHRGLPTAKLFTDLDKLEVGDVFTINILDEVLTYQVEKIMIVLPDELDEIRIIPGGDYVTLLTCTPYGINSHRLLLRSKRIKTEAEADPSKVRTCAIQVDKLVITPFVAILLLILLFIYWWLIGDRSKPDMDKYWYIPYKRVEKWEENKKE